VTKLKRYSILIHRWTGVLFCLLFVLWFVSGIVMMYWDYPGVSSQERIRHAQPLDPSLIRISPSVAVERAELGRSPDQMRLVMLDGHPLYRMRVGRGEVAVYADSGALFEELPQDAALRVASRFTGQTAAAATFEGMNREEDQWTVSQNFRDLRPLYVYSWPGGETVYVSAVTGEVVQHTTLGSRIGAYFGAIPHWLYFTPLRKNGPLWSKVVIWSSGIGTVLSLLGIVVGVWMYSPSRRYRFPGRPSSVPYVGWKRWHTIFGLIFGLVTCTWVFSGMLSMGPFDALEARPDPRVAAALRGSRLDIAAFEQLPIPEALRKADGLSIVELEFTRFAGEAMYRALAPNGESRLIPLQGATAAALDPGRIVRVIAQAVGADAIAESRLVTEYEAYYLSRRRDRPLPVVFIRLSDSQGSMYYIDPQNGRITASYGAASRWNRWLYHGLHSMDLPWLYRHRPAWDLLVLALMLGGTALCVTSVTIGWQRVAKKLTMWRAGAALRRAKTRARV
jgi:uncharacterized iron-regulated membrane protein